MRMFCAGFMHGVNNPELTKRLNEHVPKTMEEMMTVTTAFIRGEAAAASKKKVSRSSQGIGQGSYTNSLPAPCPVKAIENKSSRPIAEEKFKRTTAHGNPGREIRAQQVWEFPQR
ncbi:hypothetical protein Tco_0404731 [Tanacetum coccineum]